MSDQGLMIFGIAGAMLTRFASRNLLRAAIYFDLESKSAILLHSFLKGIFGILVITSTQ